MQMDKGPHQAKVGNSGSIHLVWCIVATSLSVGGDRTWGSGLCPNPQDPGHSPSELRIPHLLALPP